MPLHTFLTHEALKPCPSDLRSAPQHTVSIIPSAGPEIQDETTDTHKPCAVFRSRGEKGSCTHRILRQWLRIPGVPCFPVRGSFAHARREELGEGRSKDGGAQHQGKDGVED